MTDTEGEDPQAPQEALQSRAVKRWGKLAVTVSGDSISDHPDGLPAEPGMPATDIPSPSGPYVTVCSKRSYWRECTLVVLPVGQDMTLSAHIPKQIHRDMPTLTHHLSGFDTGSVTQQNRPLVTPGRVYESRLDGVTILHALFLDRYGVDEGEERQMHLREVVRGLIDAAAGLGVSSITMPQLAKVAQAAGGAAWLRDGGSQALYHQGVLSGVLGYFSDHPDLWEGETWKGVRVNILETSSWCIESLKREAAALGVAVLGGASRRNSKTPPAGILPVRVKGGTGTLEVLLSVEDRSRRWRGSHPELHVLGGKGDPGETVRQTAVREFWEETSKGLSLEEVDNLIAAEAEPVYVVSGKYSLYVAGYRGSLSGYKHRPYRSAWHKVHNLPSTFRPNREVAGLVWCPLDRLLDSVGRAGEGENRVGSPIPFPYLKGVRRLLPGRCLRPSNFLCKVMGSEEVVALVTAVQTSSVVSGTGFSL
ncbi:hypothetical protein KIPB_009605 [Kipferlia bialata]|uniref:Nudix hydrolase domain-containing protein n=1 Tax=Kipferlia bialata TaxID=797122 RepID=A0A9K3D222_9EUKA|nr:hypothetical protein KIPB_009605 [Kipferlia bialata]|eukprot:g9605.t1